MDLNTTSPMSELLAELDRTDPVEEAELLARWQSEVDAYANDPDLPTPVDPIVIAPRTRTALRTRTR